MIERMILSDIVECPDTDILISNLEQKPAHTITSHIDIVACDHGLTKSPKKSSDAVQATVRVDLQTELSIG